MKRLFSLTLLTFLYSSTVQAQIQGSIQVQGNGVGQTPSLNINTDTQAHIKNVNTPAATEGANYNVQVVSGLDEYRNRKLLIQQRAEFIRNERQRLMMEQQRRQAQERKLASSKQSNGSSASSMTAQDFFDRQTKILSGQ